MDATGPAPRYAVLLRWPEDQQRANILLVSEEQDVSAMIEAAKEGERVAAATALKIYALHAAFGVPVPRPLSTYIIQALTKAAVQSERRQHGSIGAALNLEPEKRKRGRQPDPLGQVSTDLSRIASFHRAREAGPSYLTALEAAAGEKHCDRRTIERSLEKLGRRLSHVWAEDVGAEGVGDLLSEHGQVGDRCPRIDVGWLVETPTGGTEVTWLVDDYAADTK